MQCIKCKKDIPENSVYCNHCGKKQAVEKRRSRRRANGQGCVYKLSGKRAKPYAAILPAKYTESGKEKRTILDCYATKTEALNALNLAISGKITDRINATLGQLFKEWSGSVYKGLSNSSKVSYDSAHKHIAVLDKKKMKDIRANDVQAIIDALGMPETGKKIKQLYSQLCKFAMSQDIITQNYAQFIKVQSAPKKEKDVFTISEIRALQERAKTDDSAKIVLIMIFTGTRIGEITAIKRENVNIDPELPYITGGNKTQAGKNRIIPIHSDIYEYVKYFYEKNTKYLLEGVKGGMLSARFFREKKYFPLLEELNIPRKTPHTTRHTFTTMLHAAGAKEENLIRIVGHTDFKTTTENYIHQSINELKQTVELLKIE